MLILSAQVFLRGLRKSFGEIPAPLQPPGGRHLREFLCTTLPAVDVSGLTSNMQRNLATAEAALKKLLEQNKFQPQDLAVFPLDRAEGKKFARQFTKNIVPTFTTSNKYLFVCSLHDLDLARDAREFCRFLHPTERLVLQGFPKETLQNSPETLRVKAAGNAYPASCRRLHYIFFRCLFLLPYKPFTLNPYKGLHVGILPRGQGLVRDHTVLGLGI